MWTYILVFVYDAFVSWDNLVTFLAKSARSTCFKSASRSWMILTWHPQHAITAMDVRMPWMDGCLFSCSTIARIATSSTRLLSSVHFNMRAAMSLSSVWPSSFLSYVYPIHISFYQLMFHLLLVFNIDPCCLIFVGHLNWFADPSFARTVVLFCDSCVYSPPFGQ
jgi:hypothetical protein